MFAEDSPPVVNETTLGIDIGTTSVKGVLADGEGHVVSRLRVPHDLVISSPSRMEHNAGQAWRRGPRRVWAKLGPIEPAAMAGSAKGPPITAVPSPRVPAPPRPL